MGRKKRLGMGFGIFMAGMLVMTFVSRVIYVSQMPRVKWSYFSAASIQNTFLSEGTLEAVNAQAVTGMEGLLVKKVCVAAGEWIEAGTVLYEVDLEDLEMQLSLLEAEERVWQAQVQTEKKEAATEAARAAEDYESAAVELERKIAEEMILLEQAQEDMDTHMFRIPQEDAPDEVWIAWADERTRIDREIKERQRAIEETGQEKEKVLREAARSMEDARNVQSQVEGAYSAGFSSIGQVQEREHKIAVWKELAERDGRVAAGQEGTVLEVMIQAGTRMGEGAVMRYADAQGSLVFRTVIPQENKSMVHTGDRVHLSFPGSPEEVDEEIDSIIQENGGYRVTVWLEAGVAQGRTEGVMEVVSTSEIYDFVIPKRALHHDGDMYYIYVLEEKNGILGTELCVRRLPVRLLDGNEDKAAVTDDLLESGMKVVVEYDRELGNGMAVMIQ